MLQLVKSGYAPAGTQCSGSFPGQGSARQRWTGAASARLRRQCEHLSDPEASSIRLERQSSDASSPGQARIASLSHRPVLPFIRRGSPPLTGPHSPCSAPSAASAPGGPRPGSAPGCATASPPAGPPSGARPNRSGGWAAARTSLRPASVPPQWTLRSMSRPVPGTCITGGVRFGAWS